MSVGKFLDIDSENNDSPVYKKEKVFFRILR